MTEVISEQENEQLVVDKNLVKDEPASVKETNGSRIIQDYDFRSPNRVSKDQIKSIRTVHENFAEIFAFFLASRLQTMATVDLVEVSQLRYSEYMLSLKNPSCFHIFDITSTQGKGLLEFTPDLVLVIVDRLLGGSGQPEKLIRGITTLEQKLINPLISKALEYLTKAWESVHHLSFRLISFESNPDFVQIAPASEIILVVSFEIKIEEESFKINICYPSFALEEVISKLSAQHRSSISTIKRSDKGLKNLSLHLNRTEIGLRVLLGKTNINIQDLLNLEIGDIMVLDTNIETNLPVYLADRLKFYGKPGIIDGNIAIKITDILTE